MAAATPAVPAVPTKSGRNCTIPFLVTSRSAAQGWLTGTPGNVDVMPTVLAHLRRADPRGTARGPSVRTFPATTLAQDRVANLHVDFNLQDSSGTAAPIDARVGGGSPTSVTGKFGQAIHLNGTTGHGTRRLVPRAVAPAVPLQGCEDDPCQLTPAS